MKSLAIFIFAELSPPRVSIIRIIPQTAIPTALMMRVFRPGLSLSRNVIRALTNLPCFRMPYMISRECLFIQEKRQIVLWLPLLKAP